MAFLRVNWRDQSVIRFITDSRTITAEIVMLLQ